MQIPAPLCYCCKYYRSPKPGLYQCKAFPSHIPEEILHNLHDHRKPYQGDNGVQFCPNEEYNKEEWDRYFNTFGEDKR